MKRRSRHHLSGLWRSSLPCRIAVLLIAVIAAAGCRRESTVPDGRTPPNPAAPARYGPTRAQPSSDIARAKSIAGTNWRSAPFYIIETDLSPATLVHSTGRYLGLFRGLGRYGLGAPTAVAWSTRDGPRSFKNGETIDVTHMEENWGLVWFAGAPGWIHWDSPWAFFLQHRPASMKLDGDGLHLTFSNRVGDVVLLPLYGAYKPPLPAHDLLVEHGLPGHKIKTWEWAAGLPRDPLVRLRFWSRVARKFPFYCEDSFSVDRAHDAVTIRSRLEWYASQDEWNTTPLALAPLSPVLGLILKDPGRSSFPVRFSAAPFDLGIFTPLGPYFGIPDVNEFTATFSLLQYIHETETAVSRAALSEASTNAAVVTAMNGMQRTVREFFAKAMTNSASDLSRMGLASDSLFARALPYYESETASNAVTVFRRLFVDSGFSTNNPPEGRSSAADAASAGDLLVTLWAYAHFQGDRDLVLQHWPTVRRLFQLGAQTRWIGFGREESLEVGRGSSACAAFARLAYLAGDLDSYGYACALFVRELVQDWARIRGSDYFRRHQPIHSMEFMQPPVYLTQLLPNGAGWEIDGPKYPAAAQTRHYGERWTHFADPDIARFIQDYLGAETRVEMAASRKDYESPAGRTRVPWALLRSWFLNEPPGSTVADAGPGPDLPGQSVAQALAGLRTTGPVRFERLIPGGDPTPFVAGPEREIMGPGQGTWLGVDSGAPGGHGEADPPKWPRLGWRNWKTASGSPWTVGHIQPVRSGEPRSAKAVPLNWNTRVVTFEMP